MYTAVAFLGWNYLEAFISNENGHANLNDILKRISFGFLIMSSLLTIIRCVSCDGHIWVCEGKEALHQQIVRIVESFPFSVGFNCLTYF